jgi:hypothetical protein
MRTNAMSRKAAVVGALAACVLAVKAPLLSAQSLEQGRFEGETSFQRDLVTMQSDARAAVQSMAESRFARAARVTISGEPLTVGAANRAAERFLNCSASAVQHTIRSCKSVAPEGAFASSLGRRVDGVTLNLHFQGKIVNMSIEFAAGNDADAVLSQLKKELGEEPKVQYWADPAHLFASYIWVDGKTEIEVTKTVKGDAGDGKVRMYVSTLLGGLPINPEDLP